MPYDTDCMQIQEVTGGLLFPEGPVFLADGSVVVVEMCAGKISRVAADGSVSLVAETGGGPNGLAVGPDGALYVCNNGGVEWLWNGDKIVSIGHPAANTGGYIQRVEIDTGKVSTLYTECDGQRLQAPNDIAFDSHGGFYFTDIGEARATHSGYGALYYAKSDGSLITRVAFPLYMPNGVAISADESTVFVAETMTARILAFDVKSPGDFVTQAEPMYYYAPTARYVATVGGHGVQQIDSIALDAEGNVCAGTLGPKPGITVIAMDGSQTFASMPGDGLTTNICFGGEDLGTAFITRSETGHLVRAQWPVAGMPLPFSATVHI